MEITVRNEGEVSIVDFEGNLETSTAAEAESAINQIIDDGSTRLLINFEKLNYISSAGLRILLATAKKLKPLSGELRICNLNATVQEVFDISGFSSILTVAATEEDALGTF